MFEAYFCPRVVRRLEVNANATELRAYLVELDHRGHSRNTIQSYVRTVELFFAWLRRRKQSIATINEAVIQQFASTCRPRRGSGVGTRAALRHLLRCLRGANRIEHPRVGAAKVITEYDRHLQSTCGLADATRLYRRRYVQEFLEFVFQGERIVWRQLTPQHVRSFIETYAKDGRAAAARVASTSLRSFFRWLKFRGIESDRLVGAVPGFREWRWARLPVVMTDDQLSSRLAIFDQSRPNGCRDYAMALCMVSIGLRVSEVASLAIGDFNEGNSVLRLVAGKTRRDRELPLSDRLRCAILRYVNRHRPKTEESHLFVRHRVPVGAAVTRELVRGVMRRAYAQITGCQHWTGTHVLRHTAATRLHRAGADLKGVADILGHLSVDTTAIYAKVDIKRLTQVALPWPSRKEVRT